MWCGSRNRPEEVPLPMLSVCVTSMNINNSYAAAEHMSTRLFTPTSSALHTSVMAVYYVILRAIARHGRQQDQESFPSVHRAKVLPKGSVWTLWWRL